MLRLQITDFLNYRFHTSQIKDRILIRLQITYFVKLQITDFLDYKFQIF